VHSDKLKVDSIIVRGGRRSIDLINDVRAYGDCGKNWKKMSEESCFQSVIELDAHNEGLSTVFITPEKINELGPYPFGDVGGGHRRESLSLVSLTRRLLVSDILSKKRFD
jgi:hypothetical protein